MSFIRNGLNQGHYNTWKLICINAVTAGLEIVSSVVFTIVPPLLLKFGYSETQMSLLFGVGPFLCLLFVPILGTWSDKCSSSFGRRRPFIFVYSLCIMLTMVMLSISELFVIKEDTKYLGMVMVTISVISVDFATQAAINPCESLMADTLQQQASTTDDSLSGYSEDSGLGFKVYSYMTTLGSCIGYLLSTVDWKTVGSSLITTSVQIQYSLTPEQSLFLLITVMFTVSAVITMASAKEKPIKHYCELRSIEESSSQLNCEIEVTSMYGNKNNVGHDESINVIENKLIFQNKNQKSRMRIFHPVLSKKCRNLTSLLLFFCYLISGFCKLFIKPLGIALFCSKNLFSTFLTKVLLRPFRDVYHAPTTMRKLFWTDLFCWMGIMGQMMYITDYVATVVYQGSPNAEIGSKEESLFQDGVRMGSFGMFLHSLVACLFAMFVQEPLIQLIGMKATYLFGLLTFAISMCLLVAFPYTLSVNLCGALSGFGTAVANTIPGTLVTKYNTCPELYLSSPRKGKGSIHDGGIGGDMAIIDTTFYLAQIILSIFLGQLVDATGLPHIYIGCSSICAFISAYCATQIQYD